MSDKQLYFPQKDFEIVNCDENINSENLSIEEDIIKDSVSNNQLTLPISEFSNLSFPKSVSQVELNVKELETNRFEMFNYLNSKDVEVLEKFYLENDQYLIKIFSANNDTELRQILSNIPDDYHLHIALSLINNQKTDLLLNYFNYFKGIPEKFHLCLLFEIINLGPNHAINVIKIFSSLNNVPANLHLAIVNKLVDEGYGFQVASNFDVFYGIPKELHWEVIKEICDMNGGWIILKNIDKFNLTSDHYFEFIQSVIKRGESFAAIEGIGKLYKNEPENQLKLAEKIIKAGYGKILATYFGITLANTLPKTDHLVVADMLIQNGDAEVLRTYIDNFVGIPLKIRKLFLLMGEINDYMEEKRIQK